MDVHLPRDGSLGSGGVSHQDFSQSDPAAWLLLITANPSKVLSVLYLSGELVMVIVMSAKMDTEDLDCIMLGWPAFFLLLL
jgi:hypothetical protein